MTSTRLPIFVLGDSRTGTMSFNSYFISNGLRSIHYFMEQSGQIEPLHLHESENRYNFLKFVRENNYDAYTDYPTRFFFKSLFDEFPDASFILTVRESTDRWEKSMRNFLSKFGMNANYANLRAVYEAVNDEIRALFTGSRHFLEICIDDSSFENSIKVSKFLGLEGNIPLTRENASDEIDLGVLSKRYTFYSKQPDISLAINSIEKVTSPGKAMISESGWTFLVNDTNDFLRVQFGATYWDESERSNAASIMSERVKLLSDKGILYYKFIVPEKNIIYREFLPKTLKDWPQNESRPAQMLQSDCHSSVYYLDKYLIDARSYGQLYFRGDTHTNWLGAWFVYRYIADLLGGNGLITGKALSLQDLNASIASYHGDLSVQLNPNLRREFDERWGFTTSRNGFDLTIKLDIPDSENKASKIEVPEVYKKWFAGRETFIYERFDKMGLRAVVFRDSTLDFCHELLAQHFSRSVFIWHQGQIYEEIVEMEKPDIIIHVMAERFIIRYNTFPVMAKVT